MLMGAGGGLWYVQHLKSENEILTLNNEKLEGAVADQKAVIEQQLKDIETIQSINKDLQAKNSKLSADLDVANEKFNKVNASGERRDVGNLAVQKPRSIEIIERKREKQRAISSKKVLDGVKKGDYRAAFEAYETLPIGQQLAGYINPVTNVPLSVTGASSTLAGVSLGR